jgi:hypothetical protein
MECGTVSVRGLQPMHVDGLPRWCFGSERPKRELHYLFFFATLAARFSFTVVAGFFLVVFFCVIPLDM